MNFDITGLCEILRRYSEIIIYGIGDYAQKIYPHLVQEGLKEKIICFTQTGECKSNVYEGIPVINIDELKCNKMECVVLVATSELYAEEIRQTLIKHQYPNILFLTDYVVNYILNKQKFLSLHTFDEYCEAIVNWYLRTHTDQSDKQKLLQELKDRGDNAGEGKDLNLIVMICGHVSIRSNRIIRALKRKGYEIVMLYYRSNGHTWCMEEFKKLDILVYECQYVEEMLYKALQYKPLIYFFEPCWGDCTWAEIMLKNKKYFGKIVIGLYDILNDGYFGQPESSLATEKYALENADGVVWRSFSQQTLEKKGFCIQGESIFFMDYCDADCNNYVEYTDTESGVLKLCMVTGVESVICETRKKQTKYTSAAKLEEILEKIGNREDCLFHMYIGKMSREREELCRQCESKYNNFKFYLNTERSQLLTKLSEYDYACNLYVKGEIPPEDYIIDTMRGSALRNYERNSFFDYFNAGLPMIATMPQKFIEYMQEYDVIIPMDISNLDIDYLKKNKRRYKENTKLVRKELNIDNQIGRLIDFFNEVSYA